LEKAKLELDRLAGLGPVCTEDDLPSKNSYKPFPLEALPSSVHDFVAAAAEAICCDEAFLAVPALVVIGAAIGNSKVIAIKESWHEPAVFWAAVVADSSSMKSPAMVEATRPLYAIQEEMQNRYVYEDGRWKRSMDEFYSERHKQRALSKPGDPAPCAPERPVPEKLLVNDVTIERLAQVQHQNPRGVCLIRDELAGWFASFTRYSDSKGPGADLPKWLEIFHARTMIVDRKGGDPPTLYIKRAACSVYGTIQPQIFSKVMCDEFFDSGLAARLLLCMPPRKPKVWTDKVIPGGIYDIYRNTINNIYLDGNTIYEHYKGPMQVFFSKAAKSLWQEWFNEWNQMLSRSQGEQAAALSKLEAYCARFALLIAAYEKQDSPTKQNEITKDQLERAIEIVGWFREEQERVYAMVRTPAEKTEQQKIVDFIRRQQGARITPRELMRSNKSRYPKSADAAKVLDGLAEKGLLKKVTIEPGPAGGRRTWSYVVTN